MLYFSVPEMLGLMSRTEVPWLLGDSRFGGQCLAILIVGARWASAIMVYKWDDRSKRDEGSVK